jgi:hypothetical protein
MASLDKYLNAMKSITGKQPMEVFGSTDIPSGKSYLYMVCNGDDLLTLGKSNSAVGKGRLKSLLQGSRPGIHNKSFIVGLGPLALGKPNRSFIVETENASAVELAAHKLLGIVTNKTPAVVMNGIPQTSIAEVSNDFFDKAVRVLGSDSANTERYRKVLEIVLSGVVFIRKNVSTEKKERKAVYRSGDVLCGSVLKAAGQLHLAKIWMEFCQEYFSYSKNFLEYSYIPELKDVFLLERERDVVSESNNFPMSNRSEVVELEEPIIVRNSQFVDASRLLPGKFDTYSNRDFRFGTSNGEFVFIIEKPGADGGRKLGLILKDLAGGDFLANDLEPSGHGRLKQYFSEYGGCYFVRQSVRAELENFFKYPID